MRPLPTIVLAAFLFVSFTSFAQEPAPWNNNAGDSEYHILAFVGQVVSLEERALNIPQKVDIGNGETVMRVIPSMDVRYEASFKVSDVVNGSYDEEIIDFVSYDHYGRPHFHKPENSLLFLVNSGNEWVHWKYLYYPVMRTTDGDWAACGDPFKNYKDKKPNAPYMTETIAFIEPIINSTSQKKAYICEEGARASDLFVFNNETRFQPQRRRQICNEELGLPPFVIAGTGSAPNTEEIAIAHADCVLRLKLQNLP